MQSHSQLHRACSTWGHCSFARHTLRPVCTVTLKQSQGLRPGLRKAVLCFPFEFSLTVEYGPLVFLLPFPRPTDVKNHRTLKLKEPSEIAHSTPYFHKKKLRPKVTQARAQRRSRANCRLLAHELSDTIPLSPQRCRCTLPDVQNWFEDANWLHPISSNCPRNLRTLLTSTKQTVNCSPEKSSWKQPCMTLSKVLSRPGPLERSLCWWEHTHSLPRKWGGRDQLASLWLKWMNILFEDILRPFCIVGFPK